VHGVLGDGGGGGVSPSAKFAEIDAANPDVWRLFERFTFELIRRRFSHYSADAVLHRVRWETSSAIDDASSFKINNNWSAFYARKFHAKYPKYEGFFRLRASMADAA
jgi:hypothetical protein